MKYYTIFLVLFLTGCVTPSAQIPKEPVFLFDFVNFIGDRISVPETHSASIKTFTCHVDFPDNHTLLSEAKPYCRVFQNNELIAQKEFDENGNVVLEINKSFSDVQLLYAEMGIVYCRKGEQGLCLSTKVLYAFIMDKDLPAQDYSATYKIPDNYYR